MKIFWPWHYAGLEPLNKKRRDWKLRYAAAFQVLPCDKKASDSVNRDVFAEERSTTELSGKAATQ
jgi:hypothetical protein